MSAILKRRASHLCALAVGGAVLVVADAGADDARTDHKCVWNCGGPATRTIIIEREVEIVHQLGPPQIVWKLPNVDGATQSSFGAVTDAGVRGELESQ